MKNSQIIMDEIDRGLHKSRLDEIYIDGNLSDYQRDRYLGLIEGFNASFGAGEIEIYSAPGRTEIGGNHTDHQGGSVLAAAANLDAVAAAGKTTDDKIEIRQEGYDPIIIDLNSLERREAEAGTAAALVRGTAKKLTERGYFSGGFKAYVANDVLSGSGLSSSAAFEVLIGTVISGLYNGGEISPAEIAKAAQYAENVYFGKPCGLMDQMASAVGGLVHMDFRDGENPAVKRVAADLTKYGHSLCIVDTKGSHADLTEDYAAVPAEMAQVARYFGKDILSQVDENIFMGNIKNIREKTGDRAVLRAMNFFCENRRVFEEAEALERGDFDRFLALVGESGDSSFKYLQNIYSVRDIRSQGIALALAVSERVLGGRGASRVHGGGFAGTVQAFVPEEMKDKYRSALDGIFGVGSCAVLRIRKYGGIKVL